MDDIFLCRTALARAKAPVELQIVRDVDDAIGWLAGDPPFNNRQFFPLPDLIVCDLRLREETGLKLLHWARATARFRELPIIIHSGSYMPGQIDECLKAGATAALRKEPLCQQLVEAINLVAAPQR